MIGEWDDTADEWLWQEAPWNGGERMLEHVALDTHVIPDLGPPGLVHLSDNGPA